MADFNQPVNSSAAVGVLDQLKALIVSVAKMGIGTSDTNEPEGRTRYNETAMVFQKKSGASWVDFNFHAAIQAAINAAVASAAVPTGTILYDAGSTPPAGFLACDGSAQPRQSGGVNTPLFTRIGTTYGSGDGTTTYNLPNCKARFILGRDSTVGATTFKDLNEKAGSLNHTHSISAHVHTIATHRHGMAHDHTTPNHTHTVPAHVHLVEAHSHAANGPGSDVAIVGGGSHQHLINARESGTFGTRNYLAETGGSSGPSDEQIPTVSDATSAHGHDHTQFTGRIGNTLGGRDGDDAFFTRSTDGVVAIPSSGGGTTGAANPANTDYSGVLSTTGGEGAGSTLGENPAYIILNCIIKT